MNLWLKKNQTVASIFSLLNDFRLSKYNGRPLGFINPLLYSHASSGFTDIVSGSNPGCGTEGNTVLLTTFPVYSHFPLLGFPAVKGWDPVSYSSRLFAFGFFFNPFLYCYIGYGARHAKFFEAERARRLQLITLKFQDALDVYSE